MVQDCTGFRGLNDQVIKMMSTDLHRLIFLRKRLSTDYTDLHRLFFNIRN